MGTGPEEGVVKIGASAAFCAFIHPGIMDELDEMPARLAIAFVHDTPSTAIIGIPY
jgi:hypothetical protein